MTTKYERYEEKYEEGREAEPEWEGVEVQSTLRVTWQRLVWGLMCLSETVRRPGGLLLRSPVTQITQFIPGTSQVERKYEDNTKGLKDQMKVTHERFSIYGSTEDPSEAKYPPDHDDQEPEEEDIVHVHSVYAEVTLERKLWQENQKVQVAEEAAYKWCGLIVWLTHIYVHTK